MTTGLVGQDQITTFTSPVNGTSPIDANTVRGNDNTLKTAFNLHDADPTVHFQSSLESARPPAGIAGRKWLDTDTGRVFYDDGATWNELPYMVLGDDVELGDVTITGTLTIDGPVVGHAATFETLTVVPGPARFGGPTGAGSQVQIQTPDDQAQLVFVNAASAAKFATYLFGGVNFGIQNLVTSRTPVIIEGATDKVTLAKDFTAVGGNVSLGPTTVFGPISVTGNANVTGTVIANTATLLSTTPLLRFNDTDGTVDQRIIDVHYETNRLDVYARADSIAFLRIIMQVFHSGLVTIPTGPLVVGNDPGGAALLRLGGSALLAGKLTVGGATTAINFLVIGNGTTNAQLRVYNDDTLTQIDSIDPSGASPRLLQFNASQYRFATGAVVIGTDPGGPELLRVGGSVRVSSYVSANQFYVGTPGNLALGRDANFTNLYAPDGTVSIQAGGAGVSSVLYHSADTIYFRNRAGSMPFGDWAASGLTVNGVLGNAIFRVMATGGADVFRVVNLSAGNGVQLDVFDATLAVNRPLVLRASYVDLVQGNVYVRGSLQLPYLGGGGQGVAAGAANSGGAGFRMLVIPN